MGSTEAGGAGIDATDHEGCTALMMAGQGGHESTLRALLEAGAALDITNREGGTVLMAVAAGGLKLQFRV